MYKVRTGLHDVIMYRLTVLLTFVAGWYSRRCNWEDQYLARELPWYQWHRTR